MPKITAKLVERDVEVKTVEKRTVEVYEYEGREYSSKQQISEKIVGGLHLDVDDTLESIARQHYCWTDTKNLLSRIKGEDYVLLYKAMRDKVKVLEELGAI